MSEIATLEALEILDSRGNPTLAVTAILSSGVKATAKIPSGASTVKREAIELLDLDKKRYNGKGVLNACANVKGVIQQALSVEEGAASLWPHTAPVGRANRAKAGNTVQLVC
jgi:enolase